MGSACWGTNESYDCCWVGFGYGSCFDTTRYWVSIECLRAMAMIDIDANGCTYSQQTYTEMEDRPPFKELPDIVRYRHSSLRIQHPKGEEESLRWYLEYEKWCGYYKDRRPYGGQDPFRELLKWLETIPEGPIIKRLYEMHELNQDNEGRLNGKTEDENHEPLFWENSFNELCYKEPIRFSGNREADKKMIVQKAYDLYLAIYRTPTDAPDDLSSMLCSKVTGPNANDPYARERGDEDTQEGWVARKPYVMKVDDRGDEVLIYLVDPAFVRRNVIYVIDITRSYLPENNPRFAEIAKSQEERKEWDAQICNPIPSSWPIERYTLGGYYELITNDYHYHRERHYSEYECQSLEWYSMGGERPRKNGHWNNEGIKYLP